MDVGAALGHNVNFHNLFFLFVQFGLNSFFFSLVCYLSRNSIAAVSPAVIVPSLFRIRQKGYGVAKGIPTLIIAVSGIDDAVSVAGFGIIISIMLGDGGELYAKERKLCKFVDFI